MKDNKHEKLGALTGVPLELLPKNEQVFVFHMDDKGFLRYIITTKQNRETWFLYEFLGDSFKKIGKATTPNVLEEKYIPWCSRSIE